MSHVHRFQKAFDTVEAEAVIKVLANQGAPTQYIRLLRELYNNFTTRISPFYKEINVKGGVWQGDNISPKFFRAALENIMRHMEMESIGVKGDGQFLQLLRFSHVIERITQNIERAEQVLGRVRQRLWKIGLRLNLKEPMSVLNGLVPELLTRWTERTSLNALAE